MSETTDAPTPRQTGAVEPMHASDEGIADAVMAMCRTLGHVEARKSIVHLLRAWKASRPDAASASVTEAMRDRILEAAMEQYPEIANKLDGREVSEISPRNVLDAVFALGESAGAALAAAPRDAGREEDSELIDWLATQSAAVMASEGGRTKVFTHPATTSQGESSIEVHGDGFTEPVYAATLRDALRAARRGATG